MKMAHRVADKVFRIDGGYGFTRDFPLALHARDVRIDERSSEIKRNIIAGHLLARRGGNHDKSASQHPGHLPAHRSRDQCEKLADRGPDANADEQPPP